MEEDKTSELDKALAKAKASAKDTRTTIAETKASLKRASELQKETATRHKPIKPAKPKKK